MQTVGSNGCALGFAAGIVRQLLQMQIVGNRFVKSGLLPLSGLFGDAIFAPAYTIIYKERRCQQTNAASGGKGDIFLPQPEERADAAAQNDAQERKQGREGLGGRSDGTALRCQLRFIRGIQRMLVITLTGLYGQLLAVGGLLSGGLCGCQRLIQCGGHTLQPPQFCRIRQTGCLLCQLFCLLRRGSCLSLRLQILPQSILFVQRLPLRQPRLQICYLSLVLLQLLPKEAFLRMQRLELQ